MWPHRNCRVFVYVLEDGVPHGNACWCHRYAHGCCDDKRKFVVGTAGTPVASKGTASIAKAAGAFLFSVRTFYTAYNENPNLRKESKRNENDIRSCEIQRPLVSDLQSAGFPRRLRSIKQWPLTRAIVFDHAKKSCSIMRRR